MSEYQAVTQETSNSSNQNSQSTLYNQQAQLEQIHKEQTIPGASLNRIVSDPFSASIEDMLAMQQVLGNRILGHIVQTKLSVASARNQYEKEADQIAEQALNHSSLDLTVAKPAITPLTQTNPTNFTSSEKNDNGSRIASHWENRLKNSKGTGSPLPDDTRQFMESRLGADFSQVRVHTGFEACHKLGFL